MLVFQTPSVAFAYSIDSSKWSSRYARCVNAHTPPVHAFLHVLILGVLGLYVPERASRPLGANIRAHRSKHQRKVCASTTTAIAGARYVAESAIMFDAAVDSPKPLALGTPSGEFVISKIALSVSLKSVCARDISLLARS